jgi:hypothetical protein
MQGVCLNGNFSLLTSRFAWTAPLETPPKASGTAHKRFGQPNNVSFDEDYLDVIGRMGDFLREQKHRFVNCSAWIRTASQADYKSCYRKEKSLTLYLLLSVISFDVANFASLLVNYALAGMPKAPRCPRAVYSATNRAAGEEASA